MDTKIISRGIYIDFEMGLHDKLPHIMGVLIEDNYNCIITNNALSSSAEYKNLQVCNPIDYCNKLLDRAKLEKRVLFGYSEHEKNVISELIPSKAKFLTRSYENANMRKRIKKWIRSTRGKKHASEFETLEKKKAKEEFRNKVGLKDLLGLSFIKYDYPRHLKGFKPAGRTKGIIDQVALRGSHKKLTKSKKRDWTNLINYNEHDCRGMKHLVEFAYKNKF